MNPIVGLSGWFGDDEAYADEPLVVAVGDPVVSMSITSGAANAMTNAEVGKVAYRTNNIRVVANNVDGYQVYVQAADGSTGNLVGETNKATITGVGNNVSPASFGDNKWGYALATTASANAEALAYSTVPENGVTTAAAYSTTAATETKDFTLAFAAKFGNSVQADHYKTNVLLSVAAGAKEIVGLGFAGIEYMQDMTTDICSNAEADAEGRLIDNRDGKAYWILKIGTQCWMMQNLDYDLTPSARVDAISAWGSSSQSKYYDPGDLVYVTPLTTDSCTATKQLSDCMPAHGWDTLDNASVTFDKDFVNATYYLSISNNNIVCSKQAGSAFGDMFSQHSGCRVYYHEATHYLIGNYYNSSATSSACPVGWKVPSGSNMYTADASSDFGVFENAVASSDNRNIAGQPYYFTKGGELEDAKLNMAGSVGTYITSTSNSNNSGRSYFSFGGIGTISGASTMSGSSWYDGHSVRCVAR